MDNNSVTRVITASSTVVVEADGSYCVSAIKESTTISASVTLTTAPRTKTASKTSSYYSDSGTLLYAVTVTAEVTFDGTAATVQSAQYSYEIGESEWSFVSGSVSHSDAQATAQCVFENQMFKIAEVTLTCSPTGVLS